VIHAKFIWARVFDLAARLVGAVGALDEPVVTLMLSEIVLEAPPLSVTVTFAT
jgi:hypothetical protein